MKRIFLSSSNFSGQVILVYDIENKLIQIDMSQAILNEEQIAYMKKAVPVFYHNETFLEGFKSKSLVFIEEGFKISFEDWFKKYNYNRNKYRALPIWNRFNESDQALSWFKLDEYNRYCQMNPWYTKALPETYLKDRYFESDWTK